MSHKANKKLIAAAIEAQKAAPKPLGLKPGVVKQISFEQEMSTRKAKPATEAPVKVEERVITSAKIVSVSITPTGFAPEFRNVKYAAGAPSRLF